MKVKIEEFGETDQTFGVMATVDGPYGEKTFRHQMPKKEEYFVEDENGVPYFVKRLKKVYKDKYEKSVESLGVQGKTDYTGEYDA